MQCLGIDLLQYKSSDFSVCDDLKYTCYDISHPIYWDFVDSISTYYGLGYLFSIILRTKIVLAIIRVIHGRKFGYLVLYLLLSESFTAWDLVTLYSRYYYKSQRQAWDVVTLYYTCHHIDYPDGLIWAATWNYGLSKRSVLILGRKIFYINVKFHAILVQINTIYWHEM